MIYGLQQEHNFLCRTPNLRGYGERSHWPYKYHGPSTESGWIFILFKKMSVRSDLWYAQHSRLNNTFAFSLNNTIACSLMSSQIQKNKKMSKTSVFDSDSSGNDKTTLMLTLCLFYFLYYHVKHNERAEYVKEQRKTIRNRGKCCQVLGSMPCFRDVTFSLPLDFSVIWYHETDWDGKYIFTYLVNTILLWRLIYSP